MELNCFRIQDFRKVVDARGFVQIHQARPTDKRMKSVASHATRRAFARTNCGNEIAGIIPSGISVIVVAAPYTKSLSAS
jgi:hypothetical protein